jgi:glycosyltransferase involved in cell wall biosynthesis
MPQPLVSIIIPCYNAEPFVAEAVQSALDQTWPHKEVIVVDDGSTDGSVAVVRKFADQVQLVAIPHSGAPVARNEGIRRARGEYIKFLDADDVLLPDGLNQLIQAIESLPVHAIPYGQVLDMDSNKEIWPDMRSSLTITHDDMILACLKSNIPTPAPLHRKTVLRAVNGFDHQLSAFQEWDLHLRMALLGTIFVFYERAVALRRSHTGQYRIWAPNRDSSRTLNLRRDVNLKACQLIHDHYQDHIPPRLREEMFVRLYSIARQFACNSLRGEAEELFTRAKLYQVKTSRIGRFPFRCLRRIVGDYLATRIQSHVRRILRRGE